MNIVGKVVILLLKLIFVGSVLGMAGGAIIIRYGAHWELDSNVGWFVFCGSMLANSFFVGFWLSGTNEDYEPRDGQGMV